MIATDGNISAVGQKSLIWTEESAAKFYNSRYNELTGKFTY